MFACVIPGRVCQTNFQPVGPKHLVIDLPLPSDIREFAISLLSGDVIPSNCGVGVFYSWPPYTEWQYIGKITLDMPTQFFRAPWHGKIDPNTPNFQLGLVVEPLDVLNQQQIADQRESERALESAQGIAKDLFNFMSSFAQSSGQYANLGDVLVIPTDAVDKWFLKFKHKHAIDPYFWMRKQRDQ